MKHLDGTGFDPLLLVMRLHDFTTCLLRLLKLYSLYIGYKNIVMNLLVDIGISSLVHIDYSFLLENIRY